MAADALDAFGLGLFQHSKEVGDVGVDVAVGQQAQEMKGLAVLGVFGQLLPGLGLEESAGFNALGDQLGALSIDLAAAEGVVAHFGVAHVVVAGQTDGSAVGLEPGVGGGGEELVQSRGVGLLDRIAGAAVAAADTVHNYQYNGFFHI